MESASATSSRHLRPSSAATSSTGSTFMDGSGRSSSRPGPATAIKSTTSTDQRPQQQERDGVAALDSDRETDRPPAADHSLQRSAHRHVQRHSSGGGTRRHGARLATGATSRLQLRMDRHRAGAAGGRRPDALYPRYRRNVRVSIPGQSQRELGIPLAVLLSVTVGLLGAMLALCLSGLANDLFAQIGMWC